MLPLCLLLCILLCASFIPFPPKSFYANFKPSFLKICQVSICISITSLTSPMVKSEIIEHYSTSKLRLEKYS